jgi:hypothetical protein
MVVGLIPTVIILIVGVSVGLISGYRGGWLDNLLMRLADVLYAFPDLLFFIIAMAALRETALGQAFNGLLLLFVSLSIIAWVGLARLVRGQVLSLKQKEFVEAGRMIGASSTRIMFRHLLPNSLGPIIISRLSASRRLIITEAVLGYLGLGLRPATDPNAAVHHELGRAAARRSDSHQRAAVAAADTRHLRRDRRAGLQLPGRWSARRARPAAGRDGVSPGSTKHAQRFRPKQKREGPGYLCQVPLFISPWRCTYGRRGRFPAASGRTGGSWPPDWSR